MGEDRRVTGWVTDGAPEGDERKFVEEDYIVEDGCGNRARLDVFLREKNMMIARIPKRLVQINPTCGDDPVPKQMGNLEEVLVGRSWTRPVFPNLSTGMNVSNNNSLMTGEEIRLRRSREGLWPKTDGLNSSPLSFDDELRMIREAFPNADADQVACCSRPDKPNSLWYFPVGIIVEQVYGILDMMLGHNDVQLVEGFISFPGMKDMRIRKIARIKDGTNDIKIFYENGNTSCRCEQSNQFPITAALAIRRKPCEGF